MPVSKTDPGLSVATERPVGAARRVRKSRRREDLRWLAVTEGTIAVALTIVLQLWRASPRVPLSAPVSDVNLVLMGVKNVLFQGWVNHSPQLGAPFGQVLYDYPASAGDLVHLFMIKILGVVSHDPALVVNIFYLLGFFLVGATTFTSLRWLGIGPPAAALGAVVYTFLPYHFLRQEMHLFLAAYYAVPLGCLLILRQWGPEPLFDFRTVTARRRLDRCAVLAVGICLFMAWTGTYYAVFTGMLLLLVAAVDAISRRSLGPLLSALALTLVIMAGMAAAALPNMRYTATHGANPEVGRRAYTETEFYGLHISNLLLPVPEHRVEPLAQLRAATAASPVPGEGSETLGLFGAAGFLGLLVFALARAADGGKGDSLVGRLAGAMILSVLLGTVAGFSSVVAAVGFTQIRSWDRISVFTAFFAVAGATLAVETVTRRLARRGTTPAGLLAVVAVVALWDQTTAGMVPTYGANRARWKADQSFVAAVERRFPSGDVFQLPYVPFPENPPVVGMTDYDHLRGYIHSRRLRWSYGGIKGRESDWQAWMLTGRPLNVVVDRLAAMGFEALWIDKAGYQDRGKSVEADLKAVLEEPALVSRDQRLAVYDLRPVQKDLTTRMGSGRLGDLRRRLTLGAEARWTAGAFPLEGTVPNTFRWMGQRALLQISSGGAPRNLVLTARLELPGSDRSGTVRFRGPGVSRDVVVPPGGTDVQVEVPVPREGTTLQLETDAPRIGEPGDDLDHRYQVARFNLDLPDFRSWERLMVEDRTRRG